MQMSLYLKVLSRCKMINNSLRPIHYVHQVGLLARLFVVLLFRPSVAPVSFFRTVDGTTFTSSIKEKTVGRALYAQARAKGKMAGLVR